MLIDFISTLSVAFGVAGLLLTANFLVKRATGQPLPKWLIPAGIGAGMIAFGIWNEYTWYSRVSGQLPEGMVVAAAPTERAWYRPWTYVAPLTLRFAALDRAGMIRSTTDAELAVAPVVLLERWAPTRQVTVAFDCAGHRRADLGEGAEIGADGTLDGVDWRAVGPDDALVRAACNGG